MPTPATLCTVLSQHCLSMQALTGSATVMCCMQTGLDQPGVPHRPVQNQRHESNNRVEVYVLVISAQRSCYDVLHKPTGCNTTGMTIWQMTTMKCKEEDVWIWHVQGETIDNLHRVVY